MSKPDFAIRIVVNYVDGSSASRNYVRPNNSRMGREAFRKFALGDMLALVMSGYTDTLTYTDAHIDFHSVPITNVEMTTFSSNEICATCEWVGCDTQH